MSRLPSLLFAAALALPAAAQAADRLEIQSAWPLNLPASGESVQYFADRITASAGDSLSIRLHSAGKLVPPLQIFDAVQNGSLDAGYTTSLYVAGRFPAVQLFGGVPFGPSATDFSGWIYDGGGLEIWREIYAAQGVHTIPCGLMDAEAGGWYNFEINTPQDFSGKKIRFAGLAGEALQKLGASIVLLSGGDIYPNLEKGVIDGTEFSMPAIDVSMGFERVAKYYYLPGWHQQAAINELIVNSRKWDSLPAATRELIEDTCQATMFRSLIGTNQPNAAAVEKFKAAGIEIRQFPEAVLTGVRAAFDEVVAEQSAKDADFKRAYDSLQAYTASVAGWSEYRK